MEEKLAHLENSRKSSWSSRRRSHGHSLPYRMVDCGLGEATMMYSDAGGFGEVKKMRWMSGGAIDVAVKELHQRRPSPKALKELRKEAEAMHAMRHPNVIQLYGASLTPPHVCLVLEYAPHGSLQDVLAEEGAPSGAAVWRERFFIASDIVKGLIYLHNRKCCTWTSSRATSCYSTVTRAAPPSSQTSGSPTSRARRAQAGTMATKTSAGTVNWKRRSFSARVDRRLARATSTRARA